MNFIESNFIYFALLFYVICCVVTSFNSVYVTKISAFFRIVFDILFFSLCLWSHLYFPSLLFFIIILYQIKNIIWEERDKKERREKEGFFVGHYNSGEGVWEEFDISKELKGK